jgi:nucleotide-binding universal stress UspA family protein
MLAIKHILFPIDFSGRCCDAVPFVEALARRLSAKVTLISALPPIWQIGMGEGGPIDVDMDELKGDLEKRLNVAFERQFEGILLQRIVKVGDPGDVITRFAHANATDLIMMPTHGYGPFRSLLLGSVTAKVLHDAECPVWTTAHMQDPSIRHKEARNVLCAVDGTPQGVPLMKWAAEFAQSTGATLRLVHAVSGIVGWPERQLDQELEQVLRKEAREVIERLQESAGIKLPACIAVGDLAGVVGEEARRHDTDLILIGRGTLHGTMGRLRTRSYAIIRQAPCPVLSI